MVLLLSLLSGCTPVQQKPQGTTPTEGDNSPTSAPHWEDNPCVDVDPSVSSYGPVVATFQAEDALSPPPSGGLVLVGSSSIRRWETAFESLAPWNPIQRGMGGAWSGDVAAFAPQLVTALHPAAVLTYAGTNDLAGGANAELVLTNYRCLVQQVWNELGDIPMFYLGITPAPSRWGNWSEAQKTNQLIAALGQQHPNLHYIDIPSAFLATGEPPDPTLFVEDQLHLSESGYALWDQVIRDGLAILPPRSFEPNPQHPVEGTRILLDFGPSNADDGAPVQNPDVYGHTWNNWAPLEGGVQVFAGEAISLVDSSGAPTGIRLVISGGFLNNGLQNGGLRDPDPARLGDLAIPAATEDYFYVDGPDNPGRFAFTGLDPAQKYTLKLFGSRDWGEEARVTRYSVGGQTNRLQTSGRGIGGGGSPDGNISTIVTFSNLQPDEWGQLSVDVAMEEGAYAYLGLAELLVRASPL